MREKKAGRKEKRKDESDIFSPVLQGFCMK